MVIHCGYPVQRIICQAPLIRDCLDYIHGEFYLKNNLWGLLFRSLRNPFRIADDFLDFLQISMHRLIEIGDSPHHGRNSNLWRKGLKALTSIPFALLRAPVKIGKFLLDGGYQILKNLSYTPLRHILLSCGLKQTVDIQTVHSNSTTSKKEMLDKYFDNTTEAPAKPTSTPVSSSAYVELFQQPITRAASQQDAAETMSARFN